jgi:hypothetical protein
MKNGSERLGARLPANCAKRPLGLSLLQHSFFARPRRVPGNYGKYPSIRIDNVTEQTGADPLILSAKLLKNNIALSVTDRIEALRWAAPRGLCGLFRVGA